MRAYDPVAMENAKALLPEVEYVDGVYEAAAGADAVLLLTQWNEFKQVDLGRVARGMRRADPRRRAQSATTRPRRAAMALSTLASGGADRRAPGRRGLV